MVIFGYEIRRRPEPESIKSFVPETKDDGAVIVAQGGAYVYCWTDTVTNKLYIGSHKGADDDGYICSSKYMMEEYIKRPHTFTRQIIAHGNWDDIRNLEMTILKFCDAAKNQDFYNRSNGNREFFTTKPLLEETKRKIAESVSKTKLAAGLKHTENTKQKMRAAKSGKYVGEKNPMYGKSHTEETRQKISQARTGKYYGENNPMFGKSRQDLSIRNKLGRGKSWYNDGIKSKQMFPDQVPAGWNKGRL